ncbi:CGNR zinc finger domain-containing protein [Glycomyces tritici]|uniref:CGNR zinc finger domain-containing protein n=1 Tax=Glycomyces tritici TaxID=2665176 RepID=A0ABT7YLP0_9ACTN|nr:CGNR zinc finger domain-containing protein [Glycomyces tritici]MDN3239560.1 CGNR zinc finger domain-containing protein [Glycomyces tritici]
MNAMTPLVGEPLAIDLVNTLTAEGDLLQDPAALGAWLALEAERLPGFDTAADRAALDAVRSVRGHAAAAFGALAEGRRPPEPALRGLAAAVNAAPSSTRLTWDGAGVAATVRREGAAAERLAAELAQAAVDLLTDPAVAKLRRCGAEDCVMLFVPAHPRRQWCSPERCGNRVRVARYYERRKAGR